MDSYHQKYSLIDVVFLLFHQKKSKSYQSQLAFQCDFFLQFFPFVNNLYCILEVCPRPFSFSIEANIFFFLSFYLSFSSLLFHSHFYLAFQETCHTKSPYEKHTLLRGVEYGSQCCAYKNSIRAMT